VPEAFVMAGEVKKEFAQNRVDHQEFRATHEEFRKEFARNRADHEEFRATHEEFRKEFARNRADHEEFRKEFAQNRADHAQNQADHEEMNKWLTKLAILFERFAHDAKVFGDGIQGLNQRLDELRISVDKLAERVTLLELRLQCA
jgi:chromosome segregation ATPase